MVVYAVMNYQGHYGGDYDEMNGDDVYCLGLYSTINKAFEELQKCMNEAISIYSKYGNPISFKEEDPLIRHNCLAYYSTSDDEDDSDWEDFAITTYELDSPAKYNNGVLF